MSINYNYTPPGVQISEDVSASVAPLIATSDTVCLVGYASGTIQRQETIYLKDTTASFLPSLTGQTDAKSVSITSVLAADPSQALKFNGGTKLTANLESTTGADGTISVNSTADFPSQGTIVIGNEQITYKAKNSTTFTIESRAVNGTVVASHTSGVNVNAYDINKGYDSGAYIFYDADKTAQVTSEISKTATSIPVTNVAELPVNGSLVIDNEEITYAGITGTSEVVLVTITNATGGTFTLTWSSKTTSAIAYNATAATVETALKALTNIGDNDVAVSGSAGGPYTITFGGKLANKDLTNLTANGTSLTGSSPSISAAVSTTGGPGTLTGCQRGQNGTAPAVHLNNSVVTFPLKNSIARVTADLSGSNDDPEDANEVYKRIGVAAIPNKSYVQVTYQYEPADYWQALRFRNISAVEQRFGSKFNSDGSINSQLSLAAQIAFENGATEVIVQPVFYLATSGGTKREPVASEFADIGKTWQPTLEALRDVSGIGTIVPIVGQGVYGNSQALDNTAVLNIFEEIQNHIQHQKKYNDEYIIGILGEDGTANASYGTTAVVQSHAEALQSRFVGDFNEQLVLISKTKFKRPKITGAGYLDLGGQYMAAALAAMAASRPVSSTLTRKNVTGFSSINHPRTKEENNEDARRGLLVVEQKGYAIQVRHAITLDTSSVARSELSVVRAKHKVINSLRLTIDSQIVGQIVADNNAPLIVGSAISNTLSTMQQDNDIVAFGNVQAQIKSLDPTVIEVAFSYRPAFPVNHVNIVFAIDLTTGTLTTNETPDQINSGALNG